MFDLRPCAKGGNLDLSQIKKMREILNLRQAYWKKNPVFVRKDFSKKKKLTSLKQNIISQRKIQKNNQMISWEEILKIGLI